MTRDELDARLSSYSVIKKEIQQLQYKIKEAEQLSVSVSAISYDSNSSGSVQNPDRIGTTLVKIEDMKASYLDKINQLIKEQTETERIINSLKDADDRRLLRYRYLDLLKDWQIGNKMNISVSTYYNRVNDIFRKLGEVIK